ncbi:MAG TPA: BON domain-containing protein [Methylomirabilota bacterium]|nr:BON domain-containing protein [Methylomirabilota bacterium]
MQGAEATEDLHARRPSLGRTVTQPIGGAPARPSGLSAVVRSDEGRRPRTVDKHQEGRAAFGCDLERGVQILRAALADPRFAATPESRQKLTDQGIVAQAKAALLANPVTRPFQVVATFNRGYLMISGIVDRDDQRLAADEAVRVIPGVTGVLNEIAVRPRVPAAGV